MRLNSPLGSILFLLCILLYGCNQNSDASQNATVESQEIQYPDGTLFIIGGGKRPTELVQDMIDVSGVGQSGNIIILPMSSGEPDTAAFYARKQFTDLNIPTDRIESFQFERNQIREDWIDQLKQASLIYITGGSQSRFMDTVSGTIIHEAIHTAYQNGATIAGTSAGAAVMSQFMITGDERKHPEYTGNFRTIESENIILEEGLGLIKNAIIDQHFIYRMRMNRLISTAIENPEQVCIGIDESTAIIVHENEATVTGIGQVIVLRNPGSGIRAQNGLLGVDDMLLSVHLPGDSFPL